MHDTHVLCSSKNSTGEMDVLTGFLCYVELQEESQKEFLYVLMTNYCAFDSTANTLIQFGAVEIPMDKLFLDVKKSSITKKVQI